MSQTRQTQFGAEMTQLDAMIARLGGAAEEQLGLALDAMANRDATLARQVIAADRDLDAMEADIDRHVADIFSRRQLMAADLRVTLSSLKIASALERVGDLAKNTSRRSLALTAHEPLPVVPGIVRLGRETLELVSLALEGYSRRDAGMAHEAWLRDEALDHTYNGLMREIIGAMEDAGTRIALHAQCLFIAKNLERVGDHATFVAETTHWIVTGEQLADLRPKGPPDGLLGAAE